MPASGAEVRAGGGEAGWCTQEGVGEAYTQGTYPTMVPGGIPGIYPPWYQEGYPAYTTLGIQ